MKNGFCDCPEDATEGYTWLPGDGGVVDENLGTVVAAVAVDAVDAAVAVDVAVAADGGGGGTNCGGGYGLEPGGAWAA